LSVRHIAEGARAFQTGADLLGWEAVMRFDVCSCPDASHHRPTRRGVLAMMGAVAAGATLGASLAQAERATEWHVDTHHHIYPPRYVRENLTRIVEDSRALPAAAYTSWSPSLAVEQMDKANVRAAIVSMTSPGIWWDDGAHGREWARECNEFGAKMAKDFPGRFGMFAAIPLPDTEGSMREIAHALDVLKLDGIGLLTSYAGKPLGEPAFAAVMDELNRRQVAVFVHPTMSCCGMAIPNFNPPAIDFSTDTTRTIASLAYSGTFARCRDIKFIFSHGGGTMPMIVQRLAGQSRNFKPEELKRILPDGFAAEMKRLRYDIASVAMNPAGMAAVFKLIPVSQLFYGSDAPFGSTTRIADELARFELPEAEIRAIRRDNALRLFPRFAA
jgi:predicted TIM-barrel fold metal-dependent hydrolase